eukprot:927677-Rhodomonas_salina.3
MEVVLTSAVGVAAARQARVRRHQGHAAAQDGGDGVDSDSGVGDHHDAIDDGGGRCEADAVDVACALNHGVVSAHACPGPWRARVRILVQLLT